MKPGSKNITTKENFNKKSTDLMSKFAKVYDSIPGSKGNKFMRKLEQKDPDVFTRTYNAATGMTHKLMREPGSGNLFTPDYDFKKANIYKANAIKQHGSLKASREYFDKISKGLIIPEYKRKKNK